VLTNQEPIVKTPTQPQNAPPASLRPEDVRQPAATTEPSVSANEAVYKPRWTYEPIKTDLDADITMKQLQDAQDVMAGIVPSANWPTDSGHALPRPPDPWVDVPDESWDEISKPAGAGPHPAKGEEDGRTGYAGPTSLTRVLASTPKVDAILAGYKMLKNAKPDGDCSVVQVHKGVSKELGICNLFLAQKKADHFNCGHCRFLIDKPEATELAEPSAVSGQTLHNLQDAYEDEVNAHFKYKAFAKQAKDEKLMDIWSLFRKLAADENRHLHSFSAVIQSMGVKPKAEVKKPSVGTTLENLSSALSKGEARERDIVYPAFIRKAREEDQPRAAEAFEAALRDETVHTQLLKDAMDALKLAASNKGKSIQASEGEVRKMPFAVLLYEAMPVTALNGHEVQDIPIAVTGNWVKGEEFSITAADLQTIIDNFKKRQNGQVVVDYEHASEHPLVAGKGGAVPAAGWIHDLYTQEDKLIARIEWTPKAKDHIRTGEYRFFSPAIDWNAKDKRDGSVQGPTLTSGALTNHPFLEELPPILLSAKDLIGVTSAHVPAAMGPKEESKPTAPLTKQEPKVEMQSGNATTSGPIPVAPDGAAQPVVSASEAKDGHVSKAPTQDAVPIAPNGPAQPVVSDGGTEVITRRDDRLGGGPGRNEGSETVGVGGSPMGAISQKAVVDGEEVTVTPVPEDPRTRRALIPNQDHPADTVGTGGAAGVAGSGVNLRADQLAANHITKSIERIGQIGMADRLQTEPGYASVGGEPVHRSNFLYVGDPDKKETWALPVHDDSHIRNALARFNQTHLPADQKSAIAKKLVRLAKKRGIDTSGFEKAQASLLGEKTMKSTLKKIEDGKFAGRFGRFAEDGKLLNLLPKGMAEAEMAEFCAELDELDPVAGKAQPGPEHVEQEEAQTEPAGAFLDEKTKVKIEKEKETEEPNDKELCKLSDTEVLRLITYPAGDKKAGRINLSAVTKLVERGEVDAPTIFKAQAAEKTVDEAISAGKFLPKQRIHLMKQALSDLAAFEEFVNSTPKSMLLSSVGIGSSDEPNAADKVEAAVRKELSEHKDDKTYTAADALQDATRRNPRLWDEYRAEIAGAEARPSELSEA
jgi:rubrerythrin/phage I-like protein